jgi:competence protein ComEC
VSDRTVVALAVVTMLGGWLACPLPVAVVAVAIVAACVARRSAILWCAAGALAASLLGARSWDGVESAPTSGSVSSAAATIVRDPQWFHGSLRVEMRLADGRRVSATARGDAASVLSDRLAGERLVVDGIRRPLSARSRGYLARRHIGSALTVTSARDPNAGGPVARFTNQLRRTLVDGTTSMSTERRALFTGLVLGDDREQSAVEVDDFRAAGLTHLLAVSGQNVAFVLAVVAPALQRSSLRTRLVVGVAVLLGFGVLTRWEPSVLRAVAMAALALLSSALGRPASSLRLLAVATTGLVLVDPMLAGSIGFLLSVGACTGIALIAPWLQARRFPAPLAVTLAAQVGVAPVLLPVFGTIPSASLPANLLAVPAAGPVMVWGLVAGLPAGLLGGTAATALHVPTRVLLWWIAAVAHAAAASPLPPLGPVGAVSLLLGALAVAMMGHAPPRRRLAIAALGLVALYLAGHRAHQGPPVDEARPIAIGAQLWRRDGAVVLVLAGNADEQAVLGALRAGRIRRVDVLVLRSGGSSSARLRAAVTRRADVRVTLAPSGSSVPNATTVAAGDAVRVGPFAITVDAAEPRLDVRVGSPRAPRARSPPV